MAEEEGLGELYPESVVGREEKGLNTKEGKLVQPHYPGRRERGNSLLYSIYFLGRPFFLARKRRGKGP